jgi:hypothetical protein
MMPASSNASWIRDAAKFRIAAVRVGAMKSRQLHQRK